jgi:hypothetical protein
MLNQNGDGTMKRRFFIILLASLTASWLFLGCSSRKYSRTTYPAQTDIKPDTSSYPKTIKPATPPPPPPPQVKIIPLDELNLNRIHNQASTSGGRLEDSLIDSLVNAGAECLNSEAGWIDAKTGRKIYDILKTTQGNLVTDSVAKFIYANKNRQKVLFLAVKLGIPGTQKKLNNLLLNYGDKKMAEDYLNSGSKELHSGGEDWARANGYFIATGPGSHRVTWGNF